MNVAILVRVSTNRQDTERQIADLREHAESQNWNVVEVIEEQGVSRRADSDARHGLKRAVALAMDGHIQKVMVHEVSRIGRPAILHPWIEELHKAGVSLYWHSQRTETLLPDGTRSMAAGMMLAIFSEMAHAEIEMLSSRIRSGIAEARRKGVHCGRKAGTGESDDAFLGKHADVRRRLSEGHSVRNTAKLTGKASATVLKVKRLVTVET